MRITKIFTFDAAHHLPKHKGKCKNVHGHTYALHVCVKGEVDEVSGMVKDFGDIKEIVKRNVLEILDHADLNTIIPQPTAEHTAIWIWKKLENRLNLHKITLHETPSSFVEYYGPKK